MRWGYSKVDVRTVGQDDDLGCAGPADELGSD